MPRAELSKKSPYWLPKQEYLTAKHFALQYPRWIQETAYGLSAVAYDGMPGKSSPGDPTAAQAQKNEVSRRKAKLVEDAVREAGADIYDWLLMGVTNEDINYYHLQELGMPCGKNYYYQRRQKFFWNLAKKMDNMR